MLRYTLEDVEKKFTKESGELDFDALSKLPTLLLKEGQGDEIVRFAKLSRVLKVGKDYQLDYTIDHSLPKLTNADLKALETDLDLDGFEFSTNHWSVKDVDFFEVLYRHGLALRPKPTAFQLSDKPLDPKLVCMMMPFLPQFTPVYEGIKAGLEADGFKCSRADDVWIHQHIMQDVLELICTAKVVICDLSGKNPNVFYETGIAHSLGKDVILITNNIEDIPFDLRSIRCVTYLNNNEGREGLIRDVRARVKDIANR